MLGITSTHAGPQDGPQSDTVQSDKPTKQ
uniref:Uncharacterized protein n=1 Tax=Anguilla anguilla TaxID=7936 RepID=A0A0E9TB78_ANGAN